VLYIAIIKLLRLLEIVTKLFLLTAQDCATASSTIIAIISHHTFTPVHGSHYYPPSFKNVFCATVPKHI